MIAVRQQNVSHAIYALLAKLVAQRLSGQKRAPHHQPLLRHRQPQFHRPGKEMIPQPPVQRLAQRLQQQIATAADCDFRRALLSWLSSRKYEMPRRSVSKARPRSQGRLLLPRSMSAHSASDCRLAQARALAVPARSECPDKA